MLHHQRFRFFGLTLHQQFNQPNVLIVPAVERLIVAEELGDERCARHEAADETPDLGVAALVGKQNMEIARMMNARAILSVLYPAVLCSERCYHPMVGLAGYATAEQLHDLDLNEASQIEYVSGILSRWPRYSSASVPFDRNHALGLEANEDALDAAPRRSVDAAQFGLC
nr:hypothetical protein [Salibaculum sp.]